MDWKANRHYERQFYKIERDVLWNLDEEAIKDYAKDHLDLKDEDDNDCDCDDKDISDFENDELMSEISRRKLLGYSNVNIVSIDLFTRFSRVITVAHSQDLETIISELEKKYNL
jgi:DNA integrity scanning protein DisA with diadenylate cyclase activity